MSHFFVVVVLPKDAADPEEEIGKLMEPYNEHTQVAPYDEKCYCVGSKARAESNEVAWPDMKGIRDSFHEKYKDASEEDKDRAWQQEVYLPRAKVQKEFFENHPLRNAPDPDCDDCNGTGIRSSTYNPKSKWDWWRIGGRWDGAIQKVEVESADGGFNFHDRHETLGKNMAPVEMLIEKYVVPFALVTPDGAWHERASMGWFGIATLPNGEVEGPLRDKTDDDGKWKASVREILEKYVGHDAVGIDCHI